MKNVIKLIGTITIVIAIGFSMTACGGAGSPPTSGGTPQTGEYVSKDSDGTIYHLTITEKTGSKAAYSGKNNDSYELEIIKADDTVKTSKGTVTVNGGTITCTPTGATATFSVTLTGGNMTNISGTITFTTGGTETLSSVSTTATGKSIKITGLTNGKTIQIGLVKPKTDIFDVLTCKLTVVCQLQKT
jgi:hypothetical protein